MYVEQKQLTQFIIHRPFDPNIDFSCIDPFQHEKDQKSTKKWYLEGLTNPKKCIDPDAFNKTQQTTITHT